MTDKTLLAAAVAITALLTSNGATAEGYSKYSYKFRGLGAQGGAYTSWCDDQSCTSNGVQVNINAEVAKGKNYIKYGEVYIYYEYYNWVNEDYHNCYGYGYPTDFNISTKLETATIEPFDVVVYCDDAEPYNVDVSASWEATTGPYTGRNNSVYRGPGYFSRYRDSGQSYDANFNISISGAPWQGLDWDTYGSINKSKSGSMEITRYR